MENVRRILEGPEWCEVWNYLGANLLLFADIGLDQKTADSEIWRKCQADGLVLITANRNENDPESLEAIIKCENSPTCLPDFTVTDHESLRVNQDYVRRVAIKMLEHLLDIEDLRGTGRLFIP
jgi:hypothetical protein